MEFFPGIAEPTDRDRLAAELADEQLNLVHGLRDIRIQRGMTLAEVADLMGIDQSQVSRFESGATNPTMSTIRRYAKTVMGVFRVQVSKWEDDQLHSKRFKGTLMSPIEQPSLVSYAGFSPAPFRVKHP